MYDSIRLASWSSPHVAVSAQERLHRRHWAPSNNSKPTAKIVTALARELAGFVWAIGVESERELEAAKDGVAA